MAVKADAAGRGEASDMSECIESNGNRFSAFGMCDAKTIPHGIPLRAPILGDARGRGDVLRCFYAISVLTEARCFPANCNSSG
jgi:hypothetical protein